MSSQVYPIASQGIANRTINFTADSLYMALVDNSYAFDVIDTTWGAVSAHEATGVGYTAGGQLVTGAAISSVINANSWSVQWAGATAYKVGQLVRPTTGNGFLYRCLVSGTSSGGEPTWPTVVGTTVGDGPITWELAGTAVVVFTCNPATWLAATISAAYAILYDHSTGDTLIWSGDFGGTVSSILGNFVVTPDAASGLFVLVTG